MVSCLFFISTFQLMFPLALLGWRFADIEVLNGKEQAGHLCNRHFYMIVFALEGFSQLLCERLVLECKFFIL